MAQSLPDLTAALIEKARQAGADAADAIAIDGTSLSLDVRGGALEHAERSEGIEIGLRVLLGRRQACVSASDTSPETLATMAERAIATAREAPEDPYTGLANPDQIARAWDTAALQLVDEAPEPRPEQLLQDAIEAETAALAVDGITMVQSASASYGRRSIFLAATNGFSGGYARSDRAISCVAISGSGTAMERDYCSEVRVFQADLPPAATVGRTAGERAVERHGARRPPTGAYPVVFDERIAASLIGHLLQASNGSAVARGASWLRDAVGERVLPRGLSVIEDPHRPKTSGSKPFDGEGLATARRAIVEDGILTGWTLDLATARRLGMESTANAARSVSAPPSPANHNIALTEGTLSRADLLREMGTGLLVTSMIGSTINPTTGDYSRGASGFWVENGEIAYPVNECTIAGSLPAMLRGIVPANDARRHLSRVVPSLLVEGLTIAGG